MKASTKSEGSESLSSKVRDLEAKLSGNRSVDKKPKDLIRAIGKFPFKMPLFLSISILFSCHLNIVFRLFGPLRSCCFHIIGFVLLR